MKQFKLNKTHYRIRRNDCRNLVLQKKRPKAEDRWDTIAYCGNSPKSLVRAVSDVFISQYDPEDLEVRKALESLEKALLAYIEIIKEWIGNDNP